jgi:hypothetical protein
LRRPTSERIGDRAAGIQALTESGVKVLFVTHLFDLAHGFYLQEFDTALFLRAEREPDGNRTFRLLEGEPLPTSSGEDSFRRIFGREADAASETDAASVSRA